MSASSGNSRDTTRTPRVYPTRPTAEDRARTEDDHRRESRRGRARRPCRGRAERRGPSSPWSPGRPPARYNSYESVPSYAWTIIAEKFSRGAEIRNLTISVARQAIGEVEVSRGAVPLRRRRRRRRRRSRTRRARLGDGVRGGPLGRWSAIVSNTPAHELLCDRQPSEPSEKSLRTRHAPGGDLLAAVREGPPGAAVARAVHRAVAVRARSLTLSNSPDRSILDRTYTCRRGRDTRRARRRTGALHERRRGAIVAGPPVAARARAVRRALPVAAGFTLGETIHAGPPRPVRIRVTLARAVALARAVGLDRKPRVRVDGLEQDVLGEVGSSSAFFTATWRKQSHLRSHEGPYHPSTPRTCRRTDTSRGRDRTRRTSPRSSSPCIRPRS